MALFSVCYIQPQSFKVEGKKDMLRKPAGPKVKWKKIKDTRH